MDISSKCYAEVTQTQNDKGHIVSLFMDNCFKFLVVSMHPGVPRETKKVKRRWGSGMGEKKL